MTQTPVFFLLTQITLFKNHYIAVSVSLKQFSSALFSVFPLLKRWLSSSKVVGIVMPARGKIKRANNHRPRIDP